MTDSPDTPTALRCTYCKNPCDGTKRDHYGELVLGRPLIVCDECDEWFSNEDGPWNEIS